MNPERWQEVEAIYHAALERTEVDREAFLREACGGDQHLLREVESLLGFDSRGAKLLEQPAAMSAVARPALSPGTRLGAYEIIGLLGAGGMGEVYRARDTRLDRTVALKVLPGDVMQSKERRERFEREARAVSRLSHPNICTLYDVGREGDTDFLVMEYLEGEPLALRLQRGSLPLDEVLSCAVQVAGALAVAHEQGVIHRDLKPGNVVLTRSGAKLLDFGLAKFVPLGGDEDGRGDSHSPTEAHEVTREGTILGTAAYMSPEQARGDEVDARSDLFSLGVMLYESLTGRNPFRGPTLADTLGAILKDRPDSVASLRPGTPGELARLVERLLSKSRDDRPASARVLLEELGRIAAGTEAAATTARALAPSPGGAIADAAPDRSIAVLPFANLSTDPDNEFFSDGLAEELITDLSSVKALRVISRASSRQLRGTDKGMREIGRLLGVRYALTGSARKAGNAIRVTAQLVDTATDAQLWAERFSGTLDDVFDVQERVSRAIVAALQVTLSALEDARLAERPIRDARAYELYLKAQELVRRYGAPEDRVLALLDHATAIEGPALPLRALRCYVKIMQMRAGMRTDAEHLKEAEAEARALLAEAPEQAHGHALLGFIAYERGDLKGAVRGLSAALERDASDADARFFLGISLEAAGREAEALAEGLRFRELDPLSPMAGLLLGSAYWFVGRPQEGLEPQEFALTIDPDNPILHWTLGYTHALVGNTSLARTHADWMRSSVPAMPYTTHLSALVLAMEGRRDEALTTLRALGPTIFDAHLTFHLSEAYALAGELDAAIRLLADGVERGFHPYPFIATHCPFLAPLRGTPAFARVASRAAERVAALAPYMAMRSSSSPAALTTQEHASPPHIRSIAVLPLDNYSEDPSQDYFAEGMTDELTTQLARISRLRVISRGSAMRFKGRQRPSAPEIAETLGVDAVVEGSVLRSGDRVRITAQLIDARADRHLWARSFERTSRDVLALQGEVASAIAREIHVELTPAEASRRGSEPRIDPEAYDAYLKGRYFFNRPSDENLQKAIARFEEAIELSPTFVPALSGLSDAYLWAGYNEGFLTASEARPRARAVAEQAIRLDDSSAEAHTSLAVFRLFFEYDWSGSEAEFRRAIALNPSYAYAHDQLAIGLAYQGRIEESIAETARAAELDPLSPQVPLDGLIALTFQRDYQSARRLAQRSVDLDPTYFLSVFSFGWIDIQEGKLKDAILNLEKAQAMESPAFVNAWLAYAYGASGDRDRARAELGEVEKQSLGGRATAFNLALCSLGVGDHARAVSHLERAYAMDSEWLGWLRGDRVFDPLRSDPRFVALMRKLGFVTPTQPKP